MKAKHSSLTGASQPPVARWLVWAVLILIGGTVLLPLVAAFVFDADGGLNMVLPGLLVFVVFAVIIGCWQSALTLRGGDARPGACGDAGLFQRQGAL